MRTATALVLFVSAAALADAGAATCTHELAAREIAGTEIVEVTCEDVSARLVSLRSEMFYRRWVGEIEVKSTRKGRDAKVALAAFDDAGNLIGTATFYRQGLDPRPKKIPFRMEGMFTSLAEAKKILLGISFSAKAGT